MIKAVFFDIDGTLISMKTRKLLPSTLDTLYKLKDNGIRLFISSRYRSQASQICYSAMY